MKMVVISQDNPKSIDQAIVFIEEDVDPESLLKDEALDFVKPKIESVTDLLESHIAGVDTGRFYFG